VLRARWRLSALGVAMGLSSALIGGCVELPGIYYNVLINERPSESDCVNLTDALTAKLNLQLRPSLYPCAVKLDEDGSNPARVVAINAYFRQRRIVVEIDEFRSGSPTAPSPGTQEFAQQVMQIVHEQFPAAELVRFKAQRGPIAP
jgi:hypothetical protein